MRGRAARGDAEGCHISTGGRSGTEGLPRFAGGKGVCCAQAAKTIETAITRELNFQKLLCHFRFSSFIFYRCIGVKMSRTLLKRAGAAECRF
jgi:hypothetical protein